jgi:hypothetical protein
MPAAASERNTQDRAVALALSVAPDRGEVYGSSRSLETGLLEQRFVECSDLRTASGECLLPDHVVREISSAHGKCAKRTRQTTEIREGKMIRVQ